MTDKPRGDRKGVEISCIYLLYDFSPQRETFQYSPSISSAIHFHTSLVTLHFIPVPPLKVISQRVRKSQQDCIISIYALTFFLSAFVSLTYLYQLIFSCHHILNSPWSHTIFSFTILLFSLSFLHVQFRLTMRAMREAVWSRNAILLFFLVTRVQLHLSIILSLCLSVAQQSCTLTKWQTLTHNVLTSFPEHKH